MPILALWATVLSAIPPPGSVYKEYRVAIEGNAWRVTDPNAGHRGAAEFLPNPKISFEIGDLEGGVRAEVVLDRWGGHPGTEGKRIRLNGHEWLGVTELTTTPAGHRPECFMSQDNPVIEVPLAHLREGTNLLEGTSGGQVCYSFNWGQWGQNAAIVRVYYGEGKPHPVAKVVSPLAGSKVGEDPVLRADVESPDEIDQVDFLAWYEGYDENGNGLYTDWHHAYFYNRRFAPSPEDPRMSGHAGSVRGFPFEVVWNTRWVPDQPNGQLQIVARVRGKDETWFVTDVVGNLSLVRDDVAVKFYPPRDVPERYWVRADRRAGSTVLIPETDNVERAIEASVHLRTWNGYHERFTFNGWSTDTGGLNHVYAYTVRPIPVEQLWNGENRIEFHSATEHHGVEILWPGPGLVVRYRKGDQ